MSTDFGYIYRIVNKHNQKCYIGKTKSKYGEMSWSVKDRWKRHLTKAFSKNPVESNECPLFYRALRKYGKEAFKVETLLTCELNLVNDFEIKMISAFLANDRQFGYNIANGGKGRSVVNVDEKTRERLSRCKDDKFPLNIRPVYRKEKLVGYRVRRIIRKKEYIKVFSSTKFSPEENFLKAKKWLENFKENKENPDIPYNKKSALPKHIFLRKKDGKPIGYEVHIIRNKKRYQKRWASSKETMKEKLEKALQYRDMILNSFVTNVRTSSKEEQDNPQRSF